MKTIWFALYLACFFACHHAYAKDETVNEQTGLIRAKGPTRFSLAKDKHGLSRGEDKIELVSVETKIVSNSTSLRRKRGFWSWFIGILCWFCGLINDFFSSFSSSGGKKANPIQCILQIVCVIVKAVEFVLSAVKPNSAISKVASIIADVIEVVTDVATGGNLKEAIGKKVVENEVEIPWNIMPRSMSFVPKEIKKIESDKKEDKKVNTEEDKKVDIKLINERINQNANPSDNAMKILTDLRPEFKDDILFSAKKFKCDKETCKQLKPGIYALGICTKYYCHCNSSKDPEERVCKNNLTYDPVLNKCANPITIKVCGA